MYTSGSAYQRLYIGTPLTACGVSTDEMLPPPLPKAAFTWIQAQL